MAMQTDTINLFDTENGSAVIPNQWLHIITRPTGTPDFKAIYVLQYFVAIHRPRYDEDGNPQPRFAEDVYFTTTRQIANRFNLTYDQARAALKTLIQLDLISTESVTRTIYHDGRPYRLNGLEIKLNFEKIEAITNPKPLVNITKEAGEKPENHSSLNTDSCHDDMHDDSIGCNFDANIEISKNQPEINNQPSPRTQTEKEHDTDKIRILKQIGVDDSRVIPEILAMPHATVDYLQQWASAELPDWVKSPVGFIISNIRQGTLPEPEWSTETEAKPDERVPLLQALGITTTKMINRLLQLPHVTLEYLEQWQSAPLPDWVTSPVGFIISKIFKGQTPPPLEIISPAELSVREEPEVRANLNQPETPQAKPRPQPTVDPLTKQWVKVLDTVRPNFNPIAFTTMLSQSTAISLVENCLTVLIPCPRALDFLQHRAMPHLERAVQFVFGENMTLKLTAPS